MSYLTSLKSAAVQKSQNLLEKHFVKAKNLLKMALRAQIEMII